MMAMPSPMRAATPGLPCRRSHTYATSGHYTIIETVTDDDGSTGQATNTFTAGVVQGLNNPGFENNFVGWGVGGDQHYLTINTDPGAFISVYSARKIAGEID